MLTSTPVSGLGGRIAPRAAAPLAAAPALLAPIGCAIVFEVDAGLGVDEFGALRAVGTPEAPIVLRGERGEPGTWEGIGLLESGWSDDEPDRVRILNGGSGSYLDGATGLVGAFEPSLLRVANTQVTGNGIRGIRVDDTSTIDLGRGDVFGGNAWGDVNESGD